MGPKASPYQSHAQTGPRPGPAPSQETLRSSATLEHVMEIAIEETVQTGCLNPLLPLAATISQRFAFQNLGIGIIRDASET